MVLMDMFKLDNELWIFVDERVATNPPKDIANEVGEQCPDSQRENDPRETEPRGCKDRGESDRWYRQDDEGDTQRRRERHLPRQRVLS